MIRTSRVSLTDTPDRVDVSSDDNVGGHSVMAIAQSDGVILICEDADSVSSAARLPVVAGQVINFSNIVGDEPIWLASDEALDVDVVESGVI